jgi:hypothetical protein
MPEKKPLSEIKEIAEHHARRYPKGTTERAAWDRVLELSSNGDARTLSDDPTVAEEKRESRKR